MRKIISVALFSALLIFALSACRGQLPSTQESSSPSAGNVPRQESSSAPSVSGEVSSAESKANGENSVQEERKLKMTVNGHEVIILLFDTPAANALYAALPMELNFSDYNGTEKIAYPPEALPTSGEPDGCDPDEGDLCLYAPWGNLCIFYKDFGYSRSLIKLGHVESGMEAIAAASGDFTAVIVNTAGK